MARSQPKQSDDDTLILEDEPMDLQPKQSSGMASGKHMPIRQVTNYQASWQETDPGEEGTFTLQLILDNGVAEHVLEVDSDDLGIMLKLLKTSDHTTFDTQRRVLMFANVDAS